MSKNIPTSCSEYDPSAPWNDITIRYTYRIIININGFQFTSEILKDSVQVGYFEINSEDDWAFIENNLYLDIEERLDEEILEQNYQVELINWSY